MLTQAQAIERFTKYDGYNLDTEGVEMKTYHVPQVARDALLPPDELRDATTARAELSGVRYTIFADAGCSVVARVAELHGRAFSRFARTMADSGHRTIQPMVYPDIGIRVDEVC